MTYLKALALLAGGVVIGLGLHAVHFRSPITFSSSSGTSTEKRPLEFLYLDSARVEAYLAQLDGGTFAQQHLSHRLTQKVNGEIAVEPVKAGASSEDESFVEREVTATAASRYVELLHQLGKEIHPVGLRQFKEDVRCSLDEGDFVSIETRALRPPIYLNPYLAAHQAGTLSALFPMPSRDPEQRKLVESRREAAGQFLRQVGENPRAVFAIQPRIDHKLGTVKYLLPMSVGQLTDERSLIKFGGGSFTLVGKVVRIFPRRGECGAHPQARKAGDRQVVNRQPDEQSRKVENKQGKNKVAHPLYVDSPTRETWEHALEGATPELICRTNPRCVRRARGGDLRGIRRQRLIEAARKEILEKMRTQTRIETAGAVILPIAIYK